jgi:hypothetical protein
MGRKWRTCRVEPHSVPLFEFTGFIPQFQRQSGFCGVNYVLDEGVSYTPLPLYLSAKRREIQNFLAKPRKTSRMSCERAGSGEVADKQHSLRRGIMKFTTGMVLGASA